METDSLKRALNDSQLKAAVIKMHHERVEEQMAKVRSLLEAVEIKLSEEELTDLQQEGEEEWDAYLALLAEATNALDKLGWYRECPKDKDRAESTCAADANFAPNVASMRIPLPPIKFETFDGDHLKWAPWWDVFQENVHRLPESQLGNSAKFSLLTAHLAGPALRAIEGIPRTSDQYLLAVDILKERFYRPGVVREQLLLKMRNLPLVKSEKDTRGLQQLVDHFESCQRALIRTGMDPACFGPCAKLDFERALPRGLRL